MLQEICFVIFNSSITIIFLSHALLQCGMFFYTRRLVVVLSAYFTSHTNQYQLNADCFVTCCFPVNSHWFKIANRPSNKAAIVDPTCRSNLPRIDRSVQDRYSIVLLQGRDTSCSLTG